MTLEELVASENVCGYVRIFIETPLPKFAKGDKFAFINRNDKLLYEGYVKDMDRPRWFSIRNLELDGTYKWNPEIVADGIDLNIVLRRRRRIGGMKPFNKGDLVYSPEFGKGIILGILGVGAKMEGQYYMVARFESLDRDVPYFYDGSRYGREHPNAGDIAIEAEWRGVEE